jgi:RNA polymerase sigma-70 factor (ECF subfamily)
MIAKNYCLMKLRDKKFPPKVVAPEQEWMPEEEEPEFLRRENLLQQLETAMKNLSAEQKQCVSLFYFQKKSYQEIAAETGFSLLQVKSYIQNGKRNLRLIIEKKTDKF